MKRVLIANRGEIAVRVIRACKDHGLESVAVYSDEDRTSLHAQLADTAYSLQGITASQTYLDIEKLIAIAKESGADAVHPGYGFLSENANFAQAVIDAGLTWIGPPPAAIRSLGDKVSARKIAAKAGAPLVAGTKDPVAGHEEVTAFASMVYLLRSKLLMVEADAVSKLHARWKRFQNFLLLQSVKRFPVLAEENVL